MKHYHCGPGQASVGGRQPSYAGLLVCTSALARRLKNAESARSAPPQPLTPYGACSSRSGVAIVRAARCDNHPIAKRLIRRPRTPRRDNRGAIAGVVDAAVDHDGPGDPPGLLERQYLLASELPGDDDPVLSIDAADLEHLLCKVDALGRRSLRAAPAVQIDILPGDFWRLVPSATSCSIAQPEIENSRGEIGISEQPCAERNLAAAARPEVDPRSDRQPRTFWGFRCAQP
jgi:hypothetical protein